MEELERRKEVEGVLAKWVPALWLQEAVEKIEAVYAPSIYHANPAVIKEPNYHVWQTGINPGLFDGWWGSEYERSDKYSEPSKSKTDIPAEHIRALWNIVNLYAVPFVRHDDPSRIQPRYKFALPDIAPAIIKRYNLGISPGEFNGSADNRAKYYKPLYLWPMRVLDSMGWIRFGQVSWRMK